MQGPKPATTASAAPPNTKPKRSLSNKFLKLFACLSPKSDDTPSGTSNGNSSQLGAQGMSSGARAQLAAQTVAAGHRKQTSISSQTSTTVAAQKEKPASVGQDSPQPPSSQNDVSAIPITSSPDVPLSTPSHVSTEYHTAPVVTSPPTESLKAATAPTASAVSPSHEVHDSYDASDSHSSILDDGERDEIPSEPLQLAQQETEQHDYENPVAVEHPTDPLNETYDERGIPLSSLGPSSGLLAPISKDLEGRKCLILDLDETLVHSSFRYIRRADFVIPVQIDSQFHNVYVVKRPGVDEFMKRVGELYEVVVFTASVSKYGDPLLDQLDIHNVVHHRLFRESCYNHHGNLVKNLDILGRPLQDVIIIDNSPTSYIFHPQHAVPVSSWFSDAHDNELLDMIPFLEDLATNKVPDVSMVLDVNLA